MRSKTLASLGVLAIIGAYAGTAEAQNGTGTGYEPASVVAGQTSATYKATVVTSSPTAYTFKLKVFKNEVQKYSSSTVIPNPGTTTSTFCKDVSMSTWAPAAGDVLRYEGKLYIAGVFQNTHNWSVTVGATRPTTYVRPSRKSSFQPVEANRYREEQVA